MLTVALALGAAFGAAGTAVGLHRTVHKPVRVSTVGEARLLAALVELTPQLRARFLEVAPTRRDWFAYAPHQGLWDQLHAGDMSPPLPDEVAQVSTEPAEGRSVNLAEHDAEELAAAIERAEKDGPHALIDSLPFHVVSHEWTHRHHGGIRDTLEPAAAPTFDQPMVRRPLVVTPTRAAIGAATGAAVCAILTSTAQGNGLTGGQLAWVLALSALFTFGALWQATLDLYTAWVDMQAGRVWTLALAAAAIAAHTFGGVPMKWEMLLTPVAVVACFALTQRLFYASSNGLTFGGGDALLIPGLMGVPLLVGTAGWDGSTGTYSLMAFAVTLPLVAIIVAAFARSAGMNIKSFAPALPGWAVAPTLALPALAAMPAWMWL